jgi:sulfite dehydrogenase (cytochrome) subunit B
MTGGCRRLMGLGAGLATALLTFAVRCDAEPLSYVLPDETATLRPGPNAELAQAVCAACHSLDYIAMQPPGRGRAFWDAEVAKMIQSYRASMSQAERDSIIDYLAQTY